MSEEGDSFGSLLRRQRLRANLTHEALAARSGLSIDTISMLERGLRSTPRRSTVVALAQALRLPPSARDMFLAAAESPPIHTRPDPRPTPLSYPQRIAEDWREAHAALAAGLPKATAAMALRAVQAVCSDRRATGGQNLYEQIEELGKAETFHPTLIEWAHEIRLFGNTVDGLDGVTPQDAAVVVAFLDELLRFTYEVPDRLGKLKAGMPY